MKHWITASIAISLPVILAGCVSSTNDIHSESPKATTADTMTKKAATDTMAKAKMSKMSDSCSTTKELSFASASDDGSHEDTHPPKMAIDGNLDSDSRWSAKSEGSPKSLTLTLNSAQTLSAVGVAWLKGNERASKFSIELSADGKTYTEVIASRASSGSSNGIEQYKFTPTTAKYVRINGNGNTQNAWNSVVEAKAYGCGA